MSTKIEWCEETWNPIVGCSKASDGCTSCYAEKMACRLANMGLKGYTDIVGVNGRGVFSRGWNGKTAFVESALNKPLHWKKPKRIFVCSMGDLFHESVPFEWIDKVFAVMALCPQHTFIVLTKRAQRMLEYCQSVSNLQPESIWPLPNVILGVTAENQKRADERLQELMKLAEQGWKTVVSVEPMLSEIKSQWLPDWVICGCESGPNRRPMDIEWARDLKNQCQESGVAFFMKQMEINGKVCKDINQFPEDLRIREYLESEAINE